MIISWDIHLNWEFLKKNKTEFAGKPDATLKSIEYCVAITLAVFQWPQEFF